jgi:hypothetical protein
VIGRDDQRRAASIGIERLERRPQLGEKLVCQVQVVEQTVVPPRV